MERVSPNREHFHVMRFFRGSPALYRLSIFIKDCQLRSRQLFPGNVRLRDLHLCHIVFHLHLLHFGRILHREPDALGSHIARGGKRFRQCVGFPHHQLPDDMRFFPGYPFLDDFPVFIRHGQLRSLYFLSVRQRRFRKFKDSRFIFKGKFIGNAFLIG